MTSLKKTAFSMALAATALTGLGATPAVARDRDRDDRGYYRDCGNGYYDRYDHRCHRNHDRRDWNRRDYGRRHHDWRDHDRRDRDDYRYGY